VTLVAKFVKAPAHRRRLYVESTLLLVLIRLGIHVLPLRPVRWMASAAASLLRTVLPRPAATDVREVSSAVAAASRVVPHATCLVRALAVQALCETRQCAATLCVGVRRGSGGTLEAHAWVEPADQRFADGAHGGYHTLATFDRVRP
jgi:hypothetical protein